MPSLVTDTLTIQANRRFTYTAVLDDADFLVGAYLGDDGRIRYSYSVTEFIVRPGDSNEITGTITGYFVNPGVYTITVDAIGMNSMEEEYIAASFVLTVNVKPTFYWSRNPIWYEVLTGAPGQRVELEILAESKHLAGDYTTVVSLAQSAVQESPGANIASFRVDSILDAVVRENADKDLPTPLYSTAQQQALYLIRRFKVRYRLLNADGTTSVWTERQPATVIMGGVPYHIFPTETLLAQAYTGIQLLSYQPANYEIASAPRFLALLTPVACRLTIRYVFRKRLDSSPRIVNRLMANSSVAGLFLVPLTDYPASDEHDDFTVSVLSNTVYTGPTLTYSFQRAIPTHSMTLLFRNSLGGLETVVTTGNQTSKVEVGRLEARRIVLPNYSASTPELVGSTATGSRTIKCSTGFLKDAAHRAWLAQELLLSSDVYLLVGYQLVPVRVSSKGIDYRDTDAQLYSFSFDLEPAFNLPVFSTL